MAAGAADSASVNSPRGMTSRSLLGATGASIALSENKGPENLDSASVGPDCGVLSPRSGVKMSSLMTFLFPPHLMHPESTGRLDLFAHYGPVDDSGALRGGPHGEHTHTDLELRQMITEINRETLFELFSRPRETVEILVHTLLPQALKHHYTEKEIAKLFSAVPADKTGRMKFSDMQRITLADQRRRLLTLIKGGSILQEKRKPLPYQTYAPKNFQIKNNQSPCEEYLTMTKNINNKASLIAPLEMQNLNLAGNCKLLGELGDTNDRWDRYCAVRKSGRSSYVMARNSPRVLVGTDPRLDRHPGCSTLLASAALDGNL